jgi:hypothetical protein
MSVENFKATIWAAKVMANLRKALVYGDVVNTDYQGQIANLGDSVKINAVGDVTIGDYVPGTTTVTPQELDAYQTTLTVDQAKYFAFKVDDVDVAQGAGNAMSEGMASGAYGLKEAADSYIAGLYSKAGNITAATAVNSKNALACLMALKEALDKKNVPADGRFCVVPSWIITKLVLARVITQDQAGAADAWNNGTVARVAGFDLRQSNNVPVVGGTNYKIMAGIKRGISFAGQVSKVEAYRPEASFSDAVKGLYLFGAKVIDPDSLAVGDFTVGAES